MCQILHDLGPSLVFITSMVLEKEKDDKDTSQDDNTIAIFASSRSRSSSDSSETSEMWRIDSPILPGRYTGTGDLCAALLLAWTDEHPDNLSLAMEKVIGTMHSVIKRTAEASVLKKNGDADNSIILQRVPFGHHRV